MKKYIAFDVGGTKIKHGILNEKGDIIEKGKYNTKYKQLDEFVDMMKKVIKQYTSKYDIEGIAISLPGFIDYNTGYSVKAGAIECLNGKNLKEILEKELNIPVEIENDANCAGLAEKFNGNAVGCNDFICMTVGTGIGGAVIVDGNIVHGHDFRGGELGFMVNNDDKLMMNENSSTGTLVKEYKKYKKIDEECLVEGYEVFKEAEKDENVNKMIENLFDRISRGIFNLAVILDPEKILLGGGISEREGFIEKIEEKLYGYKEWKNVKVDIGLCKHGNDAGLIGAVYNFIKRHDK